MPQRQPHLGRMWRCWSPIGCCTGLPGCCWLGERKAAGGNAGHEADTLGWWDLDDPSQALHKGGLHPLCAEEKAVWGHRARVVAGLTPPEPEPNEDGGWGLETDGPVLLVQDLAEAEVQGTEGGTQQCEAFVVSNCAAGLRWDVLEHGGVQLKAPLSSRPFF